MRGAVVWGGAVLVWGLVVGPGALAGQSTVERSPNLEGVWATAPGSVQFNFMHRFQVTGAPTRKVLNSPTFLLATGVAGGVVVGGRYASNSILVSGRPNEWELFGRWVAWREGGGGPADVGIQLSHNGTAGSVDGEVQVGRGLGPLRLLLAGRAFSSFRGEDGAVAVVGGAAVRLGRYVSLAADVSELLVGDGERVAWSGGVQFEIPYSPHSMSVHVSNVHATTLQGSSLGLSERRWGFEFTVPVTLRRYVAGRAPAVSAAPAPADAPVGAVVEMDNRLRYVPDTVRVAVGEAVVWRNTSDIDHTVTADPRRAELDGSVRLPAGAQPFDSGDMRPGEEFVHVFDEPGEYTYFCVPHERAGMIGVVVVTEG
jgi:plastocyanin